MITKVQKWGHNQGLRFPKPVHHTDTDGYALKTWYTGCLLIIRWQK
ncbi:MAG: hypothetical protein KKD28_12950 [Chloroflexi bacterium]|nr:hypothetical protein [Chloroflexota bacterium]MBU1662367.1 hypothetical protein [Chloroflexota bacterium]